MKANLTRTGVAVGDVERMMLGLTRPGVAADDVERMMLDLINVEQDDAGSEPPEPGPNVRTFRLDGDAGESRTIADFDLDFTGSEKTNDVLEIDVQGKTYRAGTDAELLEIVRIAEAPEPTGMIASARGGDLVIAFVGGGEVVLEGIAAELDADALATALRGGADEPGPEPRPDVREFMIGGDALGERTVVPDFDLDSSGSEKTYDVLDITVRGKTYTGSTDAEILEIVRIAEAPEPTGLIAGTRGDDLVISFVDGGEVVLEGIAGELDPDALATALRGGMDEPEPQSEPEPEPEPEPDPQPEPEPEPEPDPQPEPQPEPEPEPQPEPDPQPASDLFEDGPIDSYTSGGGRENFNIQFDFQGNGWTVDIQREIVGGIDFITDGIVADIPDADGVDDLRIEASLAGADLKAAARTFIRVQEGGYKPEELEARTVTMKFNEPVTKGTALDQGNVGDFAAHELFHALGIIGTSSLNQGDRFVGEFATSMYNEEFPELAGRDAGSDEGVPFADAHWKGFDILSKTSFAALEDMGFDTYLDNPFDPDDLTGPVPDASNRLSEDFLGTWTREVTASMETVEAPESGHDLGCACLGCCSEVMQDQDATAFA